MLVHWLHWLEKGVQFRVVAFIPVGAFRRSVEVLKKLNVNGLEAEE